MKQSFVNSMFWRIFFNFNKFASVSSYIIKTQCEWAFWPHDAHSCLSRPLILPPTTFAVCLRGRCTISQLCRWSSSSSCVRLGCILCLIWRWSSLFWWSYWSLLGEITLANRGQSGTIETCFCSRSFSLMKTHTDRPGARSLLITLWQ